MTRSFVSAATVDDALSALSGGARPVAGGTDLVVGARQGKAPLPDAIVAIDARRISSSCTTGESALTRRDRRDRPDPRVPRDRRIGPWAPARHARDPRRHHGERRDPHAIHGPRRRLGDRRVARDAGAGHDRRQRDERVAGDGHRWPAPVLRRTTATLRSASGERSIELDQLWTGPGSTSARSRRAARRARGAGAVLRDRLLVRASRVPPPDGDRRRRRDRRRDGGRRPDRRRSRRDHGADADDPARPRRSRRVADRTAATQRSRPPRPRPRRPRPRSATCAGPPSTAGRWRR